MLEENENLESFLEYPSLPPHECMESSCKDGNCRQTGYQYADISLPITLVPRIHFLPYTTGKFLCVFRRSCGEGT